MAAVTGVLGSVIPKLALLLKEEYKLQTGVREKIETLSQDLESMHAALLEMGQVPPEELDEPTKVWERHVRELSYEVEDILDTFLVRVDGHKNRDPNRFKRAAKKISEFFTKTKVRHQIAGMIESINDKAEKIASRRDNYKVPKIVSKPAAPQSVDPRLEAMHTEMTKLLVGIEKPMHELISKLSPLGDDETKMVSVVGAGGLGKTTLAKAVYDKLKVDFQCTAFVPVGRNPDLNNNVFIAILIELDKEFMDLKYRSLDRNQLIKRLQEYLKDKRYASTTIKF